MFQISANEDEERDAFKQRMSDVYAGVDWPRVESGIIIPETSVACPQDAQDAHQAAVDFVNTYDNTLTYMNWLNGQLSEQCSDLETDYEGIHTIAQPKLNNVIERRDSLANALWVFKGIDYDDSDPQNIIPEETYDEFYARYE